MVSDIPIPTEIYTQYMHVTTHFKILTSFLSCVFNHMIHTCKRQPEIRLKKAKYWHAAEKYIRKSIQKNDYITKLYKFSSTKWSNVMYVNI